MNRRHASGLINCEVDKWNDTGSKFCYLWILGGCFFHSAFFLISFVAALTWFFDHCFSFVCVSVLCDWEFKLSVLIQAAKIQAIKLPKRMEFVAFRGINLMRFQQYFPKQSAFVTQILWRLPVIWWLWHLFWFGLVYRTNMWEFFLAFCFHKIFTCRLRRNWSWRLNQCQN